MTFERNPKNRCIDEFLDLKKIRLEKLVKFVRIITSSIGEKPTAKKYYYELVLNDFTFQWRPTEPGYYNNNKLDIYYKGHHVLSEHGNSILEQYSPYANTWDDKLEKLIGTSDMQQYSSRKKL